jgi:hypothetical protein
MPVNRALGSNDAEDTDSGPDFSKKLAVLDESGVEHFGREVVPKQKTTSSVSVVFHRDNE